ncbi:hypothetical protein CALVIDRAFT_542988 [Calocera viscosa TUFC12733]|uniref:Zn(2)-C6 fungal-type domain-containing protein n=1 Tax=Calocera viscosa (strain TUFC12733) TaxID=1330018 RepID=A0A167G1S3_CALVF|nr:hypothetical protein CALVIDRAFT_542988 [Calocera viscosa TUFC12733]
MDMESRVSSLKTLRRTKACDACHRRKIRCDGEEGNPEPCTYCVKNNYECHFTYRPNKWPPSKTYVDGLERRVDYLERRVNSLRQEVTRLREGGGGGPSGYASSESEEFDSVSPPVDKDDEASREMTDRYEGLWLSPPAGMQTTQEPRMFHGRESHMHVLNEQIAQLGIQSLDKAMAGKLRARPEYRYLEPDLFDTVDLELNPPEWPEPDLAMLLINAFFSRYNNVFPLLHRPTFMRQYGDPAMRLERDWVALAFGIFALSSKFVDDPRVLPESGNWYGAGQKYWKEMRRVMAALYAPPTLFRLQALVLFIWFFSGSSLFPSAGWALIGLGIRYVQDAGMHLKKEWTKRAAAHPFEYELRKRVFWVLYMMERTITLEMDRSFCLQEDEHDVDLPRELDDAGLDLLQQGHTDPPGYSLAMACFNARMRLLSFASRKRTELRIIRRMSKVSDVVERERYWLQSIRIKLDHFMTNLPENLKYNKDETNDDDYLVVALLKLQYHQAQFAMYRPFLSNAKRAVHASEPILDICCKVSTSVASILDMMRERNLMMGRIHETALGGFISGTVLLMNMWEQKNYDHMDDVDKCIKAIETIEKRWQWPGRVHDVLCNLQEVIRITLGNVPHTGQPDGGVQTPELPDAPQVQPQEDQFSFSSSDGSQTVISQHSFAPLLPDGMMSATTQDFFVPPLPADQSLFADQDMSIGDWSFPNQPAVDNEASDWLYNMIFSVPPPGDPTGSLNFFNFAGSAPTT